MYTINTEEGSMLNVMISFRLNEDGGSINRGRIKLPKGMYIVDSGVSISINEFILPGHKLYKKNDLAYELYIHNYIVDKIKHFNQYNSKLKVSIDAKAYLERASHLLARMGAK